MVHSKTHQFPIWLRGLAPAEVAQCPSGVSQHAEFVIFAEQLQKGPQGALLKDVISALWAIASNVAQSPDGLLPDVQDWRRKELDKLGYGTSVDDDLGVLRCARRDVR